MNSDNHDGSPHNHHSQPHQQRRPRGFAAAAMGISTITTTINTSPRGGRNEREKEKERTKLRERHRRAITSRMLAGLRQYGNFPLPARADMNDVLAALAREAGWTVEADGTTFRQSTPSSKLVNYSSLLSIIISFIRALISLHVSMIPFMPISSSKTKDHFHDQITFPL